MTGAPGGSRWTDELLNKKRQRGDRLADDAVEELLKRGNVQAVNDLMRTLVSNDQPVPKDLPVEIQKYLAATPPVLPPGPTRPRSSAASNCSRGWDWRSPCVCSAHRCRRRTRRPRACRCSLKTARLRNDARRRVIETGQFLMNVLAVDSFEPSGKAFRTIQHIRLMHAAVRKLIEDQK